MQIPNKDARCNYSERRYRSPPSSDQRPVQGAYDNCGLVRLPLNEIPSIQWKTEVKAVYRSRRVFQPREFFADILLCPAEVYAGIYTDVDFSVSYVDFSGTQNFSGSYEPLALLPAEVQLNSILASCIRG